MLLGDADHRHPLHVHPVAILAGQTLPPFVVEVFLLHCDLVVAWAVVGLEVGLSEHVAIVFEVFVGTVPVAGEVEQTILTVWVSEFANCHSGEVFELESDRFECDEIRRLQECEDGLESGVDLEEEVLAAIDRNGEGGIERFEMAGRVVEVAVRFNRVVSNILDNLVDASDAPFMTLLEIFDFACLPDIKCSVLTVNFAESFNPLSQPRYPYLFLVST